MCKVQLFYVQSAVAPLALCLCLEMMGKNKRGTPQMGCLAVLMLIVFYAHSSAAAIPPYCCA